MALVSERTCVVCRAKKPKNKLFRFLVNQSGISFDEKQKASGRGFYICSKECWDSAVKKKRKIRIGSDARKAITVSLPEKTFEEVIKV